MCLFDEMNLQNNFTSKSNVAITTNRTWRNGQIITVKFVDSIENYAAQEKVKKYASEWTKYANLTFKYVPKNEFADIRIAFTGSGAGGWSALGTLSSYSSSQNEASMRLGPLKADDESSNIGLILHEFGHALGLVHEQTSPAANINWNLPKVYKYYKDLMAWSNEDVDRWVIKKHVDYDTDYSTYDPLSIMHYYIDKALTTDGVGVPETKELSILDMKSINKWYPFPIVSVLESGQSIRDLPWSKRIKSPNGKYSLEFNNGLLQIIDLNENNVIWKVGDYNYRYKSNCYFESTTGNIIIKGARFAGFPTSITWVSNTSGFPGAELYLRDDGNLELIQNGIVRWSSKNGKI
ncbi:M12 family metallopeptidase [Flavobacterium sp. JAS]|uniref:M12 family metallopeptidase n=1 Tax=Flavobacterium sp. JAS TaxID=2897329 RepID=UPI001E542D4E|nr:M12 family metallopeptidase [Flavobacterium sp. JAS]MCD0470692.1 M12 family metallopeptidase [Flavobacterium sp. JAS]